MSAEGHSDSTAKVDWKREHSSWVRETSYEAAATMEVTNYKKLNHSPTESEEEKVQIHDS